MRFHTLAEWLSWQETLHPSRIELGLERVRSVWARLYAQANPSLLPFAVITVGGTNGKGSCVAYLEACYRAARYRCGSYSSPHLLRYNERVRVDGEMATDDVLCAAFARVDRAREAVALTYFEFGTLAALDIFVRSELDIVVLEVGLGGRLDAVNLIDADVSLVASVGRDHMAWLGDDLASIAREKAGIFRCGRPAVIGQRDAPPALRERAEQLRALPLQAGREYSRGLAGGASAAGSWEWHGPGGKVFHALPSPALRGRHQGDNAAAALCAIDALGDRLPVAVAAIRQGLLRAVLPGRFTVIPGDPTWVLDVAHNEQAVRALAENLSAYPCTGRRIAVLGLLSDKEPEAVVAPLATLIDRWCVTPPPSDRAMPTERMMAALAREAPAVEATKHADVEAALASAADAARSGDLVLIFGSFVTVEVALRSSILPPV